ncbi:glycosyltransferase family 2 protein [Burkholderia guangdongensis]|uniref:glycosyltransferase family 2 protein n=1 Tax=Burkholderia guangdongensis TaxID=1792500 RepID=UPI0015CDE91F|nr:glycosyltransferase family 2 protein [Burkholderia guangdongensis]
MTESVMTTLAVVVPVYNEDRLLAAFHERLCAALAMLGDVRAEIIYVNDGSTDGTLPVLRALQAGDRDVSIVNLSRNYGKEIALSAGLDYANADATIVIDADLQDPPELIPEFIRIWRQGFDVVYGRRMSRAGETMLKRASAYAFYRVIHALSRVSIPQDTGDFRLLSRRAVEALRQLPEQHRYMKGLFAWIGYPQTALPYEREARAAGTSKFNYARLWHFAIEGITSFSIAPLRLASWVGVCVALAAFGGAIAIVYRTLIHGNPVAGYPSLMVTLLFLSGVQLIGLGIVGEYLGRMFNEAKRRPLYFLQDYWPAGDDGLRTAQARIPRANVESVLVCGARPDGALADTWRSAR